MSKIPRYMDVYTSLKAHIRSGDYEVGDFLPTEGDLEEKYNVSRTTIRKAVQSLILEGYVNVQQGRGTQVIDFRSTQELNCVTSITETLRNRGYEIEVKNIYIDVVKAKKTTAARLEIPENTDIYHVQRVILADGVPTAMVENFMSMDKAKGIDQRAHEISSFYNFLEAEYGHHIDSGKDIISAKSADFIESQLLDTKQNAALITIRRVTYVNGKPLTYDKSTIRADKYQLELALVGRRS